VSKGQSQKGDRMSQDHSRNLSKGWMPLIAASLIFLSLAAIAAPISFESQWLLDEGLCISTGDVPVCEATFISEEMAAMGSLLLIADQDSPLIGKTSRGEKQLQFERTFSADSSIKVALFAELTGTLRIEGGTGEVVVRAAAIVLDAETYLPVAGMEINATTSPDGFAHSLSETGTLEVQDSGVQVSTLPAGTYIVLGSIEATAEMSNGWRNQQAEVNVSLNLEFLAGSDDPEVQAIDPSSIDQTDFIVVPLGVAGTSYAHLEPGTRGGTFYASSLSDPKGWNAVTAHESATTRYTNIMMRGLISIDPTTAVLVPELASSWEISEDGLEIIFHLRRGLQWSDGEPFTADDVLFTFNDLYYNPDVETDIRDVLRLSDGSYPRFEKLDDYTLRVSLSVPYRPILTALRSSIMPEHALADSVHKLNPDVPAGQFNTMWALDTDPSEIVGMGPFILESFSRDQSVTLRRNPYYYRVDPQGVRLPYLDKCVVLRFIDQAYALLDFRAQRMNVFVPRAEDVLTLLSTATEDDFTVVVDASTPICGTSWICINQDYGLAEGTNENLRSLFRDLRFRKAIAHSIDKETIIGNAYSGMAVPQWSPVSRLSPYYAGRTTYGGPITDTDAVVYTYDLQESMGLLDEIGIVDRNGDGWRDFKDGTTVEVLLNTATEIEDPSFRTPIRDRICSIITDDLRAAGLKVTFQIIDFNSLVEQLYSSSLQMVLLGLDSGLDPNSEARVYQSGGNMHFWHYSAAKDDRYDVEILIDELLSKGATTFDQDVAFSAYKEYQIAYARDDLGLIFTVNPAFFYAYYNNIGNASIANPIATPSGDNGLTMDLIFLK